MESTTLKIRLAGRDIYLACRRRERFCVGSAVDCKLSIDGEGIAAEHCEIERVDGSSFLVRSLGGAALTVTGVDPSFADLPARRIVLGDGHAKEAEVSSPFILELGPVEVVASLVDDSEAEGFEEVEKDQEDHASPTYVLYQRSKKRSIEDDSGGSDSASASPPDRTSAEEPSTAQWSPPPPPPPAKSPPSRPTSPTSGRSLVRRTGPIVFACAIPALRYGALAAVAPGSFTGGAAFAYESAGVSGIGAIPLPSRGEKKTRRTRVRRSVTVSSGVFLFAAIVLSLACAGGYGWFEWRKFTLPTNPAMLREKIAEGDTSAMATLGLSLLRGEWGAKLDTAEAIRLIEDSAGTGDPFGQLALGLLQSEGYSTSQDAVAGGETPRGIAAWRRAFQSGLDSRADEAGDSRWWTLTGRATLAVEGADSEKARDWLLRADRRRYPEAAALLASVSGDEVEKAKWYRRAEENSRREVRRESAFARRLLGELHRNEEFAEADPYFGADEIEGAAKAGEPRAQLLWGALLDESGEEDEAFQWLERAAQAGLLQAKGALAGRYLTGIGTPAQPRLAVSLAEEVGAAGELSAFRVLATAYAKGIGVEQNTERAIRFLSGLAEGGDTDAAAELGGLLTEAGRGDEAVAPLRSSAEAGDMDAALSLGRILSTRSDDASHTEAVMWLEKALEEGRTEAALPLADALDHPDRSHRDPARVVTVLQSLADRGDHLSALRLSRYLLEGRGVEADPTKAFFLVKKAADAGEKSAFFALGELYEQGAGKIMASPAAALDAYRKAIEAGDARVHQRFPGLAGVPVVATSFMKSWESPTPSDTSAFLADTVEVYFHLEKPDAPRIASLESGFRQVWKQRTVKTGTAENVSLEALDHIRLEVPFQFILSREHWSVGGKGRATMDLRLKGTDDWRISRFTEKVEEWEFDPGRPNFDIGQDSGANSRRVFPALTQAEATYDLANLPRGQVDQVKAFPFADKFGGRHTLLPISLGDEVIAFSRIVAGGEVLLPVSHFDSSVLVRIESLADGQSFEAYEQLFAQLIQGPDRADPKAAALLAAAEGGDHEAEALVGEQFYDGLGTFPVNRVEALKWFVRSARGKSPLGRLWIAVMTQSGEIYSSTPARDLFREALPDLAPIIARSDAKAPYWRATGECFAGGENVSLGARQPRELLDRASQRGDLRAQLLLGETLLESNTIDGIRYLRYASDGGCATASTKLAIYYLGPGKDPRLVPDLLRDGARKNDIEAQILLGVHLAPTDPAEAAFWLHLGLHNAIQFANKNLEVRAREAIREWQPTIGDDHSRRATNFLAKKNKKLGR